MSDRPEKPAYQQVSEDLRARIRAGEYPVGSQLPPMASLMEQYTASITVVRMALRELRSAGLIVTRQGKGAFVLAAPTDDDESPSRTEFDMIMQRLDHIEEYMRQIEQRLAAVETTARPQAAPNSDR